MQVVDIVAYMLQGIDQQAKTTWSYLNVMQQLYLATSAGKGGNEVILFQILSGGL